MKQRAGRFIGVVWLLLLFLSAGATTNASAQGTGFTYQGRLQDSGTNANGDYDFQFTLWDALTGGTQQPQPTPITVTKSSVPVPTSSLTGSGSSDSIRLLAEVLSQPQQSLN
jgi:hypothetical protein